MLSAARHDGQERARKPAARASWSLVPVAPARCAGAQVSHGAIDPDPRQRGACLRCVLPGMLMLATPWIASGAAAIDLSRFKADAGAPPPRSLAFFAELVAYLANTATMDIEGPGGRLVRVTAGMQAPIVRLTAPNGGEPLSGDALTISRSASDPDGDPLTYNVRYSADDGASWEMVAQKTGEPQVAIDRIDLAASSLARVRVWASDGIHTAGDELDGPFARANGHRRSTSSRRPRPSQWRPR